MDIEKDFRNLTTEAITKLLETNIELKDRMVDIEQKMNEGGFSGRLETKGGFNVGKAVIESPQFKSLMDGNGEKARISLKTAIINATGTGQPLVQGDRLPGVVTAAPRRLHMRDLLAQGRTTSNLIEYAKENVFTNNAGPTVSGSPQQFENVAKPESAITFTLETTPVVTLAHWIPVSKQVLADSPMLQNYINTRLLYGLKLKEDTQILLGTGANGQLPGLYTNRTAYTVASPTLYTKKLDVLRDAISQIEVAEMAPNGIVLNPIDWRKIALTKVGSGDDRYVVGDPQDGTGAKLWNLPVVVTNSMAADTFLVGAFDMAAELFDREEAAVEVGLSGDDFTTNMRSILCEERLALAIYRPTALVGGSFLA